MTKMIGRASTESGGKDSVGFRVAIMDRAGTAERAPVSAGRHGRALEPLLLTDRKQLGRAAVGPPGARLGHDFSRIPVHFQPAGHPRLPAGTPAWTEAGHVHLGLPSLFMTPAERWRMLRHEAVHRLQQLHTSREETAAARAGAERLAQQGEELGRWLPRADVLRPVPALLAYPPQQYAPFTQVWIGHAGLVGEVVQSQVTVRTFSRYEDLGVSSKQTSEANAYACGTHQAATITAQVKKMTEVADATANANAKLPAGVAQRIALVVVFGDASSAGYRTHQGKGLMVLDKESFEKGAFADMIAHEGAHAIFEFHATAGGGKAGARVPDPLALRVADLFARLATTSLVPAPTGKFDPKAPPPVKDGAQPAGHVMVSDTLWSGTGGHPWENADEFFASAYGGFLRAPALLKASIAFYAKLDARIAPLASDLLDLLGKVGKPKELGVLKRPPKPAAAEQELAKVNPPPEFRSGGGWLLDPSTMPGPDRIVCLTP